ncbi:Protein msp1, mitochondrial [Smittium culicis]|uniref:dynamin GTPase n=1 Tax=Smittium culicis TaxID=133412 RepID=A0A1R1XCP6_9FUNG|nr:Protein msp1, mitochondrial [Smittium culicis]
MLQYKSIYSSFPKKPAFLSISQNAHKRSYVPFLTNLFRFTSKSLNCKSSSSPNLNKDSFDSAIQKRTHSVYIPRSISSIPLFKSSSRILKQPILSDICALKDLYYTKQLFGLSKRNYSHLKTQLNPFNSFFLTKNKNILSKNSSKRYIGEISIREYSDNYKKFFNFFGNASLRLVANSAKTAFRLGNKSAKFFSYIFAFSISIILYIEYKLQQIYKPGWLNNKIDKASGLFSSLKNALSFNSPFANNSKENNQTPKLDKSNPNNKNSNNNNNNEDLIALLPLASEIISDSDNHESIIDPEFEKSVLNQGNDSDINSQNFSDSENVLLALTKRLLEVQTLLKSIENSTSTKKKVSMQLPSIVVVGSQSSGKSSVLEAIVGQEFLPKGSNMVTRRPIELTLVHEPELKVPYCELPALGLFKITDFKSISQTLLDLNRSVPESECVSDVPIELKIHANNIPDLRLVDLPGYIQVTNRYQPELLKQKIRDLCDKYLQEPNIILAVCAADVDLANSEALLASRKNDPLGLRTIGVITKLDTLTPSQAVDVLSQKEFPLHLGYVGVVTKPVSIKNDPKNPKSGTMVLSEAQYYNRNSIFKNSRVQVSVDVLRKKLVRILDQSMSNSLSGLIDQVQSDLEETKYQIKVQYNDERITAESYLADSIDILKQRVKLFKESFGKSQIRDEIQKYMHRKIIEICSSLYWNDPKIEQMSEHILGNSKTPFISDFIDSSKRVISSTAANINLVLVELYKANSDDIHFSSNKTGLSSNKSTLRSLSIGSSGENDNSNNSSDYKNTNSSSLNDSRMWFPENDIYWNHKLDRSSGLLVKSGIGRNTTRLVVDLIMNNVYEIVNTPPFSYHPDARNLVIKIASEVLRSKYISTVEQVENTIKPFKYEIEIEPHEWKLARESSLKILDEQIYKCKSEIKIAKSSTPARQLNEYIKLVNRALERGSTLNTVVSDIINLKKVAELKHEIDTISPDTINTNSDNSVPLLDDNLSMDDNQLELSQPLNSKKSNYLDSPQLNVQSLIAAQSMVYLKSKMEILQFRRQVISSSKCLNSENKSFCAETFLVLLSQKLAHSAVLFINYELLNEFFFEMPRRMQSQLYGIYRDETKELAKSFAEQNPKIKVHLELIERKAKLEEVMGKLNNIIREKSLLESYSNSWRYSKIY